MAVLLDRIARDPTLPSTERVTGHRIENALKLYFHGHLTRAQMLAFFDIPAAMEVDFDKFKTRFDSFGTNLAGEKARLQYTQDLEACIIGLQLGDLTKAQFNTFTGLTLTTA
jgi:hypothetical protein